MVAYQRIRVKKIAKNVHIITFRWIVKFIYLFTSVVQWARGPFTGTVNIKYTKNTTLQKNTNIQKIKAP